MTRKFQLSAWVVLAAFSGGQIAEAKSLGSCATASEVSAIQVSAVQQELTDAALACGDKETALYNRFQTVFNKELRHSDAVMLSMFKRLDGTIRGNVEYDSYKTAPSPMPNSAAPFPARRQISAGPPTLFSPRRWRPTSRCWRISSPVSRLRRRPRWTPAKSPSG